MAVGVEKKTGSRTVTPNRRRSKNPSGGGALGNSRLTAITAAVLLVLLAVEGATIPMLGSLLSVHIFVGMLLLGPVALKLGSTGYRFARYYANGPEYVRNGPPAPLLRFLIAPVLVFSTLTLFGTGVALLAVPHRGAILGLHKASFIVWVGAMTIHVLAHVARVGRELLAELSGRIGGERLRIVVVVVALSSGVAIALATYSLASPWLHGGVHFHHDG